MSVIIPGMNMDHERVSIRPRNVCITLISTWFHLCRPIQTISIIDLRFMSSSCTILFFTTGPRITSGQVAKQEHRERDRASQQDSCVER